MLAPQWAYAQFDKLVKAQLRDTAVPSWSASRDIGAALIAQYETKPDPIHDKARELYAIWAKGNGSIVPWEEASHFATDGLLAIARHLAK